jgi:hypothetical protein
MVKIIIVTIYSKFKFISHVMGTGHILAYAKTKCKRGITYRNISSRVMGLVDNESETDGKHIYSKFQSNISSCFKAMGQLHK